MTLADPSEKAAKIMSEGSLNEVYRTHAEALTKYVYWLLATSAAAIALAVSQTETAVFEPRHSLLGVAVLSWALSFYYGCRQVQASLSAQYSNLTLLNMPQTHAGWHPMAADAARQGLLNAMEKNSSRAGRYLRWQLGWLIAGACFYLTWHIVGIYLRTIAATASGS